MISSGKQIVPKEVVMNPILMAYDQFGKKTPGKSPLIMLHGLLARRTQWNSHAKKIAALTDSEVITADLRNHGDSPWTNDFSHSHVCNDLELLMSHLDAKEAHLLGHGFAGRTLVQLAIQKPKLVKSLIASECSPFGVPPGFWRLSSIMRKLKQTPIDRQMPLEKAVKDMDQKLKSQFRSPIMRRLFLTNLQVKEGIGITWHFNLNSILNNLEDACRITALSRSTELGLPILFICGEASDSLPKYHLTQLFTTFPKAVVSYAGGAGYLLFKDRPGFFTDTVAQFLNKQHTI